MVKVTIDGKNIETEEGALLLEAARGIGIDVPTFCYQERLTPLASCRMCLVQIEGHPKLAPACVTHVTDGMVVNTTVPVVEKTRESMLELLLANHPLDCPVCDKAGECELQDTVFAHGAGVSRFRDDKRVFRSTDLSLNKVIIFNANRCIQCQRCVRMCDEVVGAVALGTIERGMDSEITGFENSLNSCDHCGNCIEVCPVGALMSEPYRYTSRPWDLVETDTTCTFCGTGCQLSIGVREGKLARVRSKYETGVNGETLCVKGRFGIDFIDSENRIETPMIRKEGVLVPASWREVLDSLVQHLGSEPGTKECAGITSASLGNETLYVFQKMMRTLFQTNSISSSSRWSGVTSKDHNFEGALSALIGDYNARQPLDQVLQSDCLFVLGTSVTESNPVTEYMIRLSQRDHPGRLLLGSARPSRLDEVAASSLRVLPGDEAALLSSMQAALTEGVTGINDPLYENFVQAAQSLLKSSRSVTLLVGSDIFRTATAYETLTWLQTYLTTLKSLGKKVVLQFLFDRGNQFGAFELGVMPTTLPGWVPLTDAKSRSKFERSWKTTLPLEKGSSLTDILHQCAEGDMDMLYCLHSDPLEFYPDRELAQKALSTVKFLIVQASHRTSTVEQADIVLPGAGYAEEEGTVLNNEGRVQKLQKIRKPLASAKNNLDILGKVSRTLGVDLGSVKPRDVFAEITSLLPSFSSISYEAIEGEGDFTEGQAAFAAGVHNGSRVSLKTPQKTVVDTSFSLVTGDSRFHTAGFSVHSKTLTNIEAGAYVEMNAEEASKNGIKEGDEIILRSARGQVKLPARLNKYSAQKILFIPENFPDGHLNQLFAEGDYPCRVDLVRNGGDSV